MNVILKFQIDIIISFVVKFDLFRVVFVAVYQIILETSNKIYFVERSAASNTHALHRRNASDANTFQSLYLGAFNDSFVESFEIIDESDLARLTNSFFISESSSSKKFGAIYNIIVEARIQQKTATSCTSSAFPRITMYNNHILLVLFQPIIHFFNKPK